MGSFGSPAARPRTCPGSLASASRAWTTGRILSTEYESLPEKPARSRTCAPAQRPGAPAGSPAPLGPRAPRRRGRGVRRRPPGKPLPAAPRIPPRFVPLGLLVLLCWSRGASGQATNATSLFCEFSIKPQSSAEQPWCEVRGYVKRNLFLSYNCQSKEITLVGPMRMRMNDTGFRETQKETLNDLMEELQKKVRDIKAEIYPKNGSLDLHGEMKCVRGASRYTSASWKFTFNGQVTHHFDSENGNWTVVQPAGRQFQGTLDSDRDVTNFLMKVSKGDCKSWMEYVMNHWDEKLETTVPQSRPQDMARSGASGSTPSTWIFLLFLYCAILLGIHVGVL
ncbi:UL16-binding protein 1-like [Vulpes vulpes]|uniref:UL16-binding protein 1-like n=1 Tax=Vulpes vulpes TaxID=9627 RepID=A0ABM4XA07_VULVU